MERAYVFCGCQIYPSATAGSTSKKSCWEWDIPTPKPKTKKISASNPILPTPKRFDMDSINKRYSDNLYEPVNPPPLYASGSGYGRKDPETTSLDERMIDIPADIEIVSSEGLDGLDLPDPHDLGIDGDREWRSFNPVDDDSSTTYPKTVFTAGIRGSKDLPKYGETSSVRPLTNVHKNISFSPDVPDDESMQEVPSDKNLGQGSASSTSQEAAAASVDTCTPAEVTDPDAAPPAKPSALEQLKTKAGLVKQRFSKISLPVRPKFNQWTNIKLSKKSPANGKGKGKKGQGSGQTPGSEELGDQEVPEEEVGGWTEPLSLVPEAERPVRPPQPKGQSQNQQVVPSGPVPMDIDQIDEFFQRAPPQVEEQPQQQQEEELADDPKEKKRLADEEAKRVKAQKEEELKRLREEEKLQKAKEQEELKRLKEEEKLRKEKEAEEQKRVKAEEKARKEKEKEELKKQKLEEKLQRERLQEDIKKAKEEEIQKAKELQAQMEAELLQTSPEQDQDQGQDQEDRNLELEREFELARERQRIEQELEEDLVQEEPARALKPASQIQSKLAKILAPPPSPKSPKIPKTPEEKKRKLIDLDFTKRFKRSKTPPGRPEPPKIKFSKTTKKPGAVSASNQLAAQYAQELENRQREADMEVENEALSPHARLRDPQIFVTQPSTDSSEAGSSIRAAKESKKHLHVDRELEEEDEEEDHLRNEEDDEDDLEENYDDRPPSTRKEQLQRKLKGFGVKSKAIAAQTGKNLGKTMKTLGHGIKEFGVNAVQEVKAKQEAVRQRDAQRRAEQLENLEDSDAYMSSQPKITFKFKKRGDPQQQQDQSDSAMILEQQIRDDNSQRPPIPTRHQYQQQQQQQQQQHPKSPGGHSFSSTEGGRKSNTSSTRRKLPKIPPRQDSQDDQDPDHDLGRVHRSQLLGRADRDWESPLDLAQSRDASEEPFSGNVSSRGADSPPGSSMASSSIMQSGGGTGSTRPGRQGVLEEIDSDEFFLRERGISEGEDEEEVNRFLVEELRQAFRPTLQSNALAGFDLPNPPSRPGRNQRTKPPRQSQQQQPDVSGPNFQTFPPQRPKRKATSGYVSAYINANPEAEDDQQEEKVAEEDQAQDDLEKELLEVEDEGIRRVKEELRKIDAALQLELEDDGRYEPVNQGQGQQPLKPQRSRKRKPRKLPETSTPQAFYYNTIAANDWMRDLEHQIHTEDDDGSKPSTNNIHLNLVDDLVSPSVPVAPKRERAKSGGSASRRSESLVPEIDDSEINFVDEDEVTTTTTTNGDTTIRSIGHATIPLAQGESESRLHDDEDDIFLDDAFDDVDESGYAIVHKDKPQSQSKELPKTFPRKKKQKRGGNGGGSKGNSLKRPIRDHPPPPPTNGGSNGNNGMFFSLPRYTPRTFHIVPPTRPHRTYSTLKPKRPPRNKSKSNQNLSQGQGQDEQDGENNESASTPQPPPVPTSPRPTTPGTRLAMARGGRGEQNLSDGDRPSSAVGIMHGRPLPAPPRPDRPPQIQNGSNGNGTANQLNDLDLDQSTIERMVNVRHYANYEDDAEEPPLPGMVEVHESPCIRANISLLTDDDEEEADPRAGRGRSSRGEQMRRNDDDDGEMSSILANSDINVAVQTDPVHDEDFELNINVGSFEDEEERIEKHRSSTSRLTSSDQEPQLEDQVQIPPPIPTRPLPRSSLPLLQQSHEQQQQQTQQPPPPQIVFPTRLHLDELEVDVLRVNDLTASILTLDQLRAPHLELNTVSSRGPLSVPSIHSPNLSVEHLDCQRLTSETAETQSLSSSVPPPSFYSLQSPTLVAGQVTPSQLRDELCCPEESTLAQDPSSPDSGSEERAVVQPGEAASGGDTGRTIVRPSLPQGVSQNSSADPDLEDIAHTSMRLGRALLRVTVRSLHAMAEYVEVAASNDPHCQEQQRSNMQVLLCLLLVLVAGIILVGRSGQSEPRWQFFLPPSDL